MRHFCLAIATIALLGAVAATADAGTVLTFDGQGFSDGGAISQTYGDNAAATPNITVSYRSVNATGNGTFSTVVRYGSTGFGDLSGVAYADIDNKYFEISLTAAAGWLVRLDSFDIAGSGATVSNQLLRVHDGSFNTIAEFTPAAFPGTGHTHYTPNVTNTTIILQLGPDFRAGIDNITFSQISTTPVPLPPAAAAGLGLLGVVAAFRLRRLRALRG